MARPDSGTNVRLFKAALGARFARTGLAVLSPRAPELAARWAEYLFTTARRHRRPAWEDAALASATRTEVRHDEAFLPAWTWGAGRDAPAVLLVHGWEGRGSQLAAFVDPLLREGLRVVAFDAPGHGDAPTRRANVVEHARAVAAVAKAVGNVRAVVGHSVGGAAALLAPRFGLRADRFVLIASPTDPSRFTDGFAKALRLDDKIRNAMLERLERRYGIPFDHLDATRDALGLAQPLLVVHDQDDAIVPWDAGAALARAAPDGRLVTTSGLGHRRILRAPEVVRTVVSFVGEGLVLPTFAETLDGELYSREGRGLRGPAK